MTMQPQCTPCQIPRIIRTAARIISVKRMLEESGQLDAAAAAPQKGKVYVRTWLIDDKRNGNDWRVSWNAIKRDVPTYIGRPGIEYFACGAKGCRRDHIRAPRFGEQIRVQEPYRKSTIVGYDLDEASHTAYAISEIHDAEFAGRIERGEIKYISPALWPDSEHTLVTKNTITEEKMIDTTKIRGTHFSYVDEPAYGTKARIEAMCTGSEECISKLKNAPEKSIPQYQLTAALRTVRVAARVVQLAAALGPGFGTYDESKHVRAPAGAPGGGQYAPKGNAGEEESQQQQQADPAQEAAAVIQQLTTMRDRKQAIRDASSDPLSQSRYDLQIKKIDERISLWQRQADQLNAEAAAAETARSEASDDDNDAEAEQQHPPNTFAHPDGSYIPFSQVQQQVEAAHAAAPAGFTIDMKSGGRPISITTREGGMAEYARLAEAEGYTDGRPVYLVATANNHTGVDSDEFREGYNAITDMGLKAPQAGGWTNPEGHRFTDPTAIMQFDSDDDAVRMGRDNVQQSVLKLEKDGTHDFLDVMSEREQEARLNDQKTRYQAIVSRLMSSIGV